MRYWRMNTVRGRTHGATSAQSSLGPTARSCRAQWKPISRPLRCHPPGPAPRIRMDPRICRCSFAAGTAVRPLMATLLESLRPGPVTPSVYVQEVQRVIATLAPAAMAAPGASSSSWLASIENQALTALLVYGYPALGLTLLLGAIGLPLTDGVTTTVAGSLAAQGRIDWFWAATTPWALRCSAMRSAMGLDALSVKTLSSVMDAG
jgi:hypothetical protein